MTDSIRKAWLEDLASQVTRHNLLFVQLGSVYPATRAELYCEFGAAIDVAEYLETEPAPGNKIQVVNGIEELSESAVTEFGRLRTRVYEDIDKSNKIVLLSTRPRIIYPNVPGSSLIHEAKLIKPPFYYTEGFGAEVSEQDLPVCVALRRTVVELGEALCAILDSILFESELTLDQLEAPELESLASSGLVTVSSEGALWHPGIETDLIREVLADVIGEMRQPQSDFTSVTEKCWEIERHIKHALRARAQLLWGKDWKAELLDPSSLGTSALTRARNGSYPEAMTLEDLRDPLEWLTVAESLEVRNHPDIGTLGISDRLWRKFETEFLPIKDRVERSQLLRKKDWDITLKWASKLLRDLSTSGLPDVEAMVSTLPHTQTSVLRRIKDDLVSNPDFRGEVAREFMSLAVATSNFVIHTLDRSPSYTGTFSKKIEAPKEKIFQDAFIEFLDASGLAGFVTVETGGISSGTADVVLNMNNGRRYITETKREFETNIPKRIENKYLNQTVAYQSTNISLGQLLVLDLTGNLAPGSDQLESSMWVRHIKDDDGVVLASTLVALVRGNRATPSKR